MRKTYIRRRFAVSFVEITTRADILYLRAVRFQQFLEDCGITAAYLAQFKSKIDACMAFQDDAINLKEISLACAEADAAAERLRVTIESIIRRAAMTFRRNSLEFSMFRAGKMTRLQHYKLLAIADNVLAKAKRFQPQLSEFGLTQAKIDAFVVEIEAFRALITAATDEKGKRLVMTNQRTLAYNELFADMKRISEAGKSAATANPQMIAEMFELYDKAVSKKSAAAAKKRRAAAKGMANQPKKSPGKAKRFAGLSAGGKENATTVRAGKQPGGRKAVS